MSSHPSPSAVRLSARHSRSHASHASTNASEARRLRKSPWLGSLPKRPTSTVRPLKPVAVRGKGTRRPSRAPQELPPLAIAERIAGCVGCDDADLSLVKSGAETDRSAQVAAALPVRRWHPHRIDQPQESPRTVEPRDLGCRGPVLERCVGLRLLTAGPDAGRLAVG